MINGTAINMEAINGAGTGAPLQEPIPSTFTATLLWFTVEQETGT
jgi:hypothetical protein